ncbi:MAG: M48 family metalloprotease [Flammeovirgaceae bacterium]|nr:M48 family metalloprotease [Flammeovirgaceae bacterium]
MNLYPQKRHFFFILLCILSFSGYAQKTNIDEKLGAENAKVVEQSMGLYDAPKTLTYVDAMGQRLVKNLGDQPFKYKFHLVDMNEPNAFALPGGYIYVSRGLLVLANTEDELADVISHEIIHVNKRHSVNRKKRNILPNILKVPGNIVGSVINNDLGNIINTPFEMTIAGYGRKQEKEADELGIKLAAKTGYQPQQLAIILSNISKSLEHQTGEEEKKSYLSDHPFTPKRVEYINEESEGIQITKQAHLAKNKADFLAKLEGIHFGENPNQGIFVESKFIHPDRNFVIDFPKNWLTSNTPQTVGAVDEKQQGMIILQAEPSTDSPKVYLEKFEQALKEKYKMKLDPKAKKTLDINGSKGYMITMAMEDKGQVVYLNLIWFQVGNQLMRLSGMDYGSFKEAIVNCAESVKSLSTTDKALVKNKVLRVVKAKEGETIEALGKRKNNYWDPKFTSIANGLKEDSVLKEGDLIKIIVEEPYFK